MRGQNIATLILKLLLISLSFLVTMVQDAFAQETQELRQMSLEELMNIPVYGASKFEQPVTEAPSSVSIVTSDEIKKYGYRTVADILRSMRGFLVTRTGIILI